MTIKVPPGAKAGLYAGEFRVEARGEKAVPVPVELTVVDWKLPDPQDYRTWCELVQVPDTSAIEYGVPLWGEKHWAMIARAFVEMSDSGSRVVHVPLIAHTNLGNEQSMVRWIRKPPAAGADANAISYEFDFTVMDRYLDLAVKHLGTPKIVVLQVWDLYMSSKESAGKRFGTGLDLSGQTFLNGPQVTVLDPKTGKTELVKMPRLVDAGQKPIWQALIGQVRERLRKRGLEKALMLGMFTDAQPTKEDVQFFHDLAPDLPWVQQGHGLIGEGQRLQGVADMGYQATVWGAKFFDGATSGRVGLPQNGYGWRRTQLAVDFERNTSLDTWPATRWRLFGESCITGNMRGMGRIGADYWSAVRNKEGRRAGEPHDRFPEGAWGVGGSLNLNLCNPVLGAGPDGPEATNRLVALIEGIQECEARISIERALLDEAAKARLGTDLAKRCQRELDERLDILWQALTNWQLGGTTLNASGWRWAPGVGGHRWWLGSGWQGRTEALFSLAAEVERKIAAK